MTPVDLWIPLGLSVACLIIGGLPLTGWIVIGLTGIRLKDLGTGTIGVSAAFYHGGQTAGILAVLAEAMKGILAVLLFRIFLPGQPVWEIMGLIALVFGRYTFGQGAGTTNVVWGYLLHDWKTAFLVAIIGGIGFTLVREKVTGRLSILALLPIVTALLHPNSGGRIVAVMVLSGLMAVIYHRLPDDLDLPSESAHQESRTMFKFFRGDRSVKTLNERLEPITVGAKAARLSELKRLGYAVPMGWIVPPGDDPQPLIDLLSPSPQAPLIVRSSAIGEDDELSSAAGQYDSVMNVTNREQLQQAIAQCQLSYSKPSAVQYRQTRQQAEGAMAVLVQAQIKGSFSGVAFSRDPVTRQGEAVVIEALPGEASQVVSGKRTPESYRAWISEPPNGGARRQEKQKPVNHADGAIKPPSAQRSSSNDVTVKVEGEGNVPQFLIKRVARLVRQLEQHYQDVPQDLEWSYDGQQLWVLQVRPITTLVPVWTRKIAAEVIPGFIRPLTWSINRPLTCGVWGEIFTVVLGDRARGLDFNETATLHHSSAYFNASLLGEIFRRMGLPPESLEFLTRGASFSRPPLASTLRNLPGLMRLLRREWYLPKDFAEDEQTHFVPGMAALDQELVEQMSPEQLMARINRILDLLKRATYYNIMGPLSSSLRQAVLKVSDAELDTSQLPEIAALRSLQAIARDSRPLVPDVERVSRQRSTLFTALAESPDGNAVFRQLDQFLATYGYLSDVATDIAVPTWRDDPRPVYDLFAQLLKQSSTDLTTPPSQQRWKARQVQQRIHLKGKIAEIYNRLLAALRWTFLALEQQWIEKQWLTEAGDIFFLTLEDIQNLVVDTRESTAESTVEETINTIQKTIRMRRLAWEQNAQVQTVPFLVYGKEPPVLVQAFERGSSGTQLFGIGASPGQAEGRVKVVRSLQDCEALHKDMILVVPYADSGWAPVLAQVGGLIADVGGRLSHGAIIAREYNIPAVMDVQDGTSRLQDGQTVFLDGETGIVEIL